MNKIYQFSQYILESNSVDAIKIATELIISGEYDDFWIICFSIMVEYIHIFLPNCPVFMYEKYISFNDILKAHNFKIKNIEVVYDIIIPIIHMLCNNYKQHISLYVTEEINISERTDSKQARNLLTNINKLLDKMAQNKIKDSQKIANQSTMIKLFKMIAKIFSIDCDSLTNFSVHSHYKINLFTHTNSITHDKIINVLWSILLSNAKKLDINSFNNVQALGKLYHTKLLHKIEQSSFIILNACCYFIYAYDFTIIPKIKPIKTSSKPPVVSDINMNEYETYLSKKDLGSNHTPSQNHTLPDPIFHLKQTILNDLDPETRTDIFHMRKIYQLLEMQDPNQSNSDDHKQSNFISKEQRQRIQQSIFDFDAFLLDNDTCVSNNANNEQNPPNNGINPSNNHINPSNNLINSSNNLINSSNNLINESNKPHSSISAIPTINNLNDWKLIENKSKSFLSSRSLFKIIKI